METAKATFAGGCFWCTEAVFRQLDGVVEVLPGYIDGHLEDPDYERVCHGNTGHAEAVELHYQPERISYQTLLEVFFLTHDPTTLNRQGHDIGTQYRSAVFAHDQEQLQAARDLIANLEASGRFESPIVTEVKMAPRFYPAEHFHHDYFSRNQTAGYCQVVIAPKLYKLHEQHPELLKA